MLATIVCMIPEDFDLVDYMSIKESAGIFKRNNIKLENVNLIAESVRSSFITMLNTGVTVSEINYFVDVLEDLKVVVERRIDLDTHLFRMGVDENRYENKNESNIFILINLYHLPTEKAYAEVKDSMKLLEKYKVPKELIEALKTKV